MGSKAAFFYGTLLHPMVLKRVIGNDGQHLMICPAILPVSRFELYIKRQILDIEPESLQEHTRHQIKVA